MIADLPPAHPIVAFVQRVETQLDRIPALRGHLVPLAGIRISDTPPVGYSPTLTSRIIASVSPADRTITYLDTGSRSTVARLSWLAGAKHSSFRREQRMVGGFVISADRTGPRTMSGDQEATLKNVVHELLHLQADGGLAYAHMTPGQRSVEEGSTDALAVDLVPAIAWRLWRVRTIDVGISYASCTALIRKWSARWTKTRDWRSPAARRARLAFHVAPFAQRDELLRSAGLTPGCSIED